VLELSKKVEGGGISIEIGYVFNAHPPFKGEGIAQELLLLHKSCYSARDDNMSGGKIPPRISSTGYRHGMLETLRDMNILKDMSCPQSVNIAT